LQRKILSNIKTISNSSALQSPGSLPYPYERYNNTHPNNTCA
jgi:hypothetical protein